MNENDQNSQKEIPKHYPHACEHCPSPAGQFYIDCLWYCLECYRKWLDEQMANYEPHED